MAPSKEELGEKFVDAAKEQNLAEMKRLLELGADINYANKNNKNTALHWASDKNNFEIVTYLLKNGADKTYKASNGHDAESIARYYKHLKMADFIKNFIPGPPVSVTLESPFGNTSGQLIEVFNFATRSRTSSIYNTENKTYSAPTTQGFDEIRDKSAIRRAFAEYKKQGGALDEDVIYNAIEERKKQKLPGSQA